jgi:hypothetical protein
MHQTTKDNKILNHVRKRLIKVDFHYTTTKGGLFPHKKNKIMTVFGVQNVCQVRGLPITVSVESLSSWTRAILDEMSVQNID